MKIKYSVVLLILLGLQMNTAHADFSNMFVSQGNGTNGIHGEISRKQLSDALLNTLKKGGAEVRDETVQGTKNREYIVRSSDGNTNYFVRFEVRLSSNSPGMMDASLPSSNISVFQSKTFGFNGSVAKKLYMTLLAGGAKYTQQLGTPTPAGNFTIELNTQVELGILRCDASGKTFAPSTQFPEVSVFGCTISP